MESKEQLIDYKAHLESILNGILPNLFEVTDERNLNSDESKVNVVVKQLVGSVSDDTADIPFQLDIYTVDPKSVMDIFTAIAQKRNGKPFTTLSKNETGFREYIVYEYYKTPVVMEADVDLNLNHYARVVVYVNLTILKSVSNIKSISVDGEEIEFAEATLGYVAELYSNRVSGGELNENKKTSAGVSVTMTMVNKAKIFNNKCFLIATGQMSGATVFDVTLTTSNNLKANLKMVLQQTVLNGARNVPQLPTLQVTLAYAGESE